ncbi:MAG: hypothetical protein MJ252_06645 [archaeon]|nr:hypothetical protein [archaeon]
MSSENQEEIKKEENVKEEIKEEPKVEEIVKEEPKTEEQKVEETNKEEENNQDNKEENKEETKEDTLEDIPPSDEPITSIITATIPEFNEKYVESKVVTFYTVNVINHFSRKKWVLERRYNDFEKVHRELSKLLTDIAPIPKKTVFKVSSYQDLTKRRLSLQNFLKDCVERKDILASEPFKTFLELDKNAPEIFSDAGPQIKGTLEEIPLGIRDFYYDKDIGVIFMCCSEMNILHRTDSFLGNVKFPWEKDTSHIAVGCAIVFRTQKIGGEYKFSRGFGYSFPIQTGILNWCPEANVFSVGLDDGHIYLFTHDAPSNYNNFEDLAKIKPHKDRVMGISYDNTTGKCFSCSTDKLFSATDIKNPLNETFVICRSNTGFTNLYNDKENQRMFLTNEGGEIYVFLNKTYPPVEAIHIKTSHGGCIRGFHIDLKKEFLFTANTLGNITILDLGMPGKESTIREISNFGFKTKFRLIRYDTELNLVMTGDQNGRVTVWNLKTGKTLCKIKNNF